MIVHPHRVLIVGGGSIGERHLRCFQATGKVEVSLCEIRADVRKEVSKRYSVDTHYGTFAEALQGPSDVAVVATPAHLHVPMATALVQAGKHVLIEKPLSTSTDGVDALHTIAMATKRVVGIAYCWRHHPALSSMRRACVEGQFGRIVQFVVCVGQHFPTYRPAYRDTYYVRHETGGGAIQDGLTHFLDIGRWLVGPIQSVVADAGHQVLPDVDVEDTVHVIARHGQSIFGSYCLNQHQAPNEVTVTVVGTEGTARFEHHHQRWRWQSGPEQDWQLGPIDAVRATWERDTMFIRQAESFLDAVEGRSPVSCPLPEGIATLQVNLAILRSCRERQWIDL